MEFGFIQHTLLQIKEKIDEDQKDEEKEEEDDDGPKIEDVEDENKEKKKTKNINKSIIKWNRLTKLNHFGPEVQIILNQKNKQNFIKV